VKELLKEKKEFWDGNETTAQRANKEGGAHSEKRAKSPSAFWFPGRRELERKDKEGGKTVFHRTQEGSGKKERSDRTHHKLAGRGFLGSRPNQKTDPSATGIKRGKLEEGKGG